MKLKVCGMTSLEQLQQLQELQVDYAGMIFYEGSKRYAWDKIQASKFKLQKLSIEKVGVFVNADIDFLKSCILDFGLAAVQLHGDEPPEFCETLRAEVAVIKVFHISAETKDIDSLVSPFQSSCDYFLFDTNTKEYGGSGKRFDWTILKNAQIGKPFFLSGGIGGDDMGILKSFSHPFFYAVDVNSRFETAPGIKDMDSLKTFVNVLKQPIYG